MTAKLARAALLAALTVACGGQGVAQEASPASLGCAGTAGDAGEPGAFASRTAGTLASPSLTGRVVDDASLLSADAKARITEQLQALEARRRDQLVVVTVPSLGGEPVAAFGLRTGRRWRVGQKDLNNGVLLIVAPADRKVRIEVGCGLEGFLTDERASAIIQETLLPLLGSGRYEEAIETGVSEIIRTLDADVQRPRYRTRKVAA